MNAVNAQEMQRRLRREVGDAVVLFQYASRFLEHLSVWELCGEFCLDLYIIYIYII